MIGPSNLVALQTRQPRQFDFQKLRHTTPAQRVRALVGPLTKKQPKSITHALLSWGISVANDRSTLTAVNLLPIQHQQMAPMTLAEESKSLKKN